MYARNFQYFFINFKYNALTAHLLTIKLHNFFFKKISMYRYPGTCMFSMLNIFKISSSKIGLHVFFQAGVDDNFN